MLKTTPTPEHFWGYNTTRFQNNEERAQEAGFEPCSHCGRGVAPGKGWQVEIIDGGSNICVYGEGDDKDAGYMGVWTLGSSCAKGIPAAFRVRNT